MGGGEEANTLDVEGQRPSKVINATLLPIFCPEGTLVVQIYVPFSLRRSVD